MDDLQGRKALEGGQCSEGATLVPQTESSWTLRRKHRRLKQSGNEEFRVEAEIQHGSNLRQDAMGPGSRKPDDFEIDGNAGLEVQDMVHSSRRSSKMAPPLVFHA